MDGAQGSSAKDTRTVSVRPRESPVERSVTVSGTPLNGIVTVGGWLCDRQSKGSETVSSRAWGAQWALQVTVGEGLRSCQWKGLGNVGGRVQCCFWARMWEHENMSKARPSTYVKHMSKLCQTCVKICQTHVKHISNICQTYFKSVSNICQTQIQKSQTYVKQHIKHMEIYANI